jgi:dolichol-phosphate mannosyltransferase
MPNEPDLADRPLELSIVVPTFCERDNVIELVRRLDACLAAHRWEVIFVDDDSPDGTAEIVRELAQRDPRIRGLLRIRRRGLSSACIEGMLASAAPVIAVMDGDLQHDETRLPAMLRAIREEGADLVIGTRYAQGGSLGSWDPSRATLSRVATRVSRLVGGRDVSDPMSGFFMLRREVLNGAVRKLSGMGFKILLDLIASTRGPLRIAEVPYTFRGRFAGESKLDTIAMWEFGMLLADKLVGRYVPVRFVAFALVGGAGVLVHMAIVIACLAGLGAEFTASQAVATAGAMVFNYSVNNILTYRDRRRRGVRWLTGLLSFVAACSVGALANIGIASFLFERRARWFVAALAGILVGAVWNYAVTTLYTWGRPAPR